MTLDLKPFLSSASNVATVVAAVFVGFQAYHARVTLDDYAAGSVTNEIVLSCKSTFRAFGELRRLQFFEVSSADWGINTNSSYSSGLAWGDDSVWKESALKAIKSGAYDGKGELIIKALLTDDGNIIYATLNDEGKYYVGGNEVDSSFVSELTEIGENGKAWEIKWDPKFGIANTEFLLGFDAGKKHLISRDQKLRDPISRSDLDSLFIALSELRVFAPDALVPKIEALEKKVGFFLALTIFADNIPEHKGAGMSSDPIDMDLIISEIDDLTAEIDGWCKQIIRPNRSKGYF